MVPTEFELALDLMTAKALGFAVPPTLENIECPYSTRDLSANLNKLTAEKRAAQVAELEKVLSA